MNMAFKAPSNGVPKEAAVGAAVDFEFRQGKDGAYEIVTIAPAAKK
jgi:hypothetical protein